MRSSELRALEERRIADRTAEPPAPVVSHKPAPRVPGRGWNPALLRSEVEGEFRPFGNVIQKEGRQL